MTNRRRFLQAASAVASTALFSDGRLSATETAPPVLPPSIAALKSMKDAARPVSTEERQARQERARALMEANDLDAVLLMEGTSLNYFTGIRWWGGERLFAMVLPANGAAFYVCPAFEEGRAREQLSNAPEGTSPDVRTWQEDDNPYERVAQGLKDRGITGALGLEETVREVFREGIAHA